MPNGHDFKEYGGHAYDELTQECQHGCGCWMGESRSDGPVGLDPFGACPQNPLDGKLLGGNADYHRVVEQRIQELTKRAAKAEERLRQMEPSKEELADRIAVLESKLARANGTIAQIKHLVDR